MALADAKVPTFFDRMLGQYQSSGQPYQIGAHYYYSTGAFRYEIYMLQPDANGFLRAVARCLQGAKIEFFSYAVNDPVTGVGLSPNVHATDAETNLAERNQTNNEDFAIEGIAAGSRGVRISYGPEGTFANHQTDPNAFILAPGMHQQLVDADQVWGDLGSQFVPPECSSPLTLQDGLFEYSKSFITLQLFMDRKGSDRLGRLDKIPQGGARSYLYANGEPTVHNFYRIPEGMGWRKSNEAVDKLLMIQAVVEQDLWFTLTIPTLWQSVSAESGLLGYPSHLWNEWTLWLHGRAFYVPSKNV